ncbi:phage gp6-like head-tail connector protein [Sinorhizobium medicae]|nr:head-tail connector protein [Sinorhizobium medicae]MDX0605411.1 phage gp6-like head-tail connector protein [Sinorhizobium medicae]MDX0821658.1 phage gp6-like head-tail connector protein [Sinorhizobium medicae]MDX0864749.1 phage gp6-like head-tail connector protein [Sinorhizobium medicae]RVJ19772.1 phage gp6-like head-tail connector protein [Sinorhizobium medicae]
MSIVSLNHAKAHMKLDDYADDELVHLYIDAAESWLGNYIGNPLSIYDPDWKITYGEDGEPIPPPADYNPMPADLKLAVLKLVSFYFECRNIVSFGLSMQLAPQGVTSIADSYREKWFTDGV